MHSLKIAVTGYDLAADWYEGTDSKKVLIVLPGYTSTKARQSDFVSAMVELTGTSALVIDYSGHGESPFELKDTCPAQHFLEVVKAFDWAKSQYPNAEVSLAGSSYGGFLGAHLTQYRELSNLILRAPAIYRPSEFYDPLSIRLNDEENYRDAMMKYRQDRDELDRHPLLSGADAFKGRTLVMVHENDELVPRETTDAYSNAFGADRFIAEGFVHSVSQSDVSDDQLQEYHRRIADWLVGA